MVLLLSCAGCHLPDTCASDVGSVTQPAKVDVSVLLAAFVGQHSMMVLCQFMVADQQVHGAQLQQLRQGAWRQQQVQKVYPWPRLPAGPS
jgi:hypothetical protein